MLKLTSFAVVLLAMTTAAIAEPMRLDKAELDRVVAGAPGSWYAGPGCRTCVLTGLFRRLFDQRAGTGTGNPGQTAGTPTLDEIIAGSRIKF